MTNEMALWIALGSSILAVIYGLLTTVWVLRKPAGNEKMQAISAAIQEGANAYMIRQYTAIGIVGVVLFVVVAWFFRRWRASLACLYPCALMCVLPRQRAVVSAGR